MLTIPTHRLKEIRTKCMPTATKKKKQKKTKKKKRRKEIDNIRRKTFEFSLIKSQITITFYKCCKLYW